MLQKLSKCDVRAWLCWNLTILQPLRFYVKSNFGEFKQSIISVILQILETLNFELLVNLGLESCSNLLKSKFRTSEVGKNNIFGAFEFAKIWFHVKSEWWYNDQCSTKSSINFTFWKFLEHSANFTSEFTIFFSFSRKDFQKPLNRWKNALEISS